MNKLIKNKVITLCGSAKFKDYFIRELKALTLLGNIVLMPVFDFSENEINIDKVNVLKDLHFKRIEMADEILVINKEGYIGASTKSEIEYAIKLGKIVNYLEE